MKSTLTKGHAQNKMADTQKNMNEKKQKMRKREIKVKENPGT